tara:strand:+ start:312 stop:749 length:438 start_codon:yes stop_codon:yes gene_type:complete
MNKQQEELAMRLDLKTPYKWVMDNLIPNQSSDVQERWKIMSKMVELNPEWVEEVVNNGELTLSDVLHDFRGIYSEDEHFLPRISTEKEYTFDEVWDYIIEHDIATENELRLVCNINGSSVDNLQEVIDVRTGYMDMEQHTWSLNA